MPDRQYTVVSLFSGAGGLDMGFRNQGFKVVWANDIDEDACNTHRMWSDATVVQGDIGKLDYGSIPTSDVIIGGFPCQGFSLAGPRKIDDERNKLYRYFVELVEAKKPSVFVAENVKGILTLGEGLIIEAILQDFADRGYDVYPTLVNAAEYGVPQERWRVVMMGFRKDLGMSDYHFPGPFPFKVTMRDALNSLPEPSPGDVSEDSFSPRYMSRNRKRQWDDVSYTIPAMSKQVPLHPSSPDMVKLGPDVWAFGSGGKTRRLSWQEAAALQTFPSGMRFAGGLTSIYRQIGNAVPVRLAEVVAIEVRRVLESSLIYADPCNRSAIQTKNGKGFEYACLQSIKDRLSVMQPIDVEDSQALRNARMSYFGTSSQDRAKMDKAADAATRFLIRYEPRLLHSEPKEPLCLSIQSDSKGQSGDVRDIVCLRKGSIWEIGISCKHNHDAVKHSRISPKIDFGKEWLKKPCSTEYFDEVSRIFKDIPALREKGIKWSDLESKAEDYYQPVIDAFIREIRRICSDDEAGAAQELVRYLIGANDFYKVMSNDSNMTTDIQAFNINGTLNRSCGTHKPESKFSPIRLPTRILDIYKKGNNTVEITCDNGWALSFRVHNANSMVEPSLKFDVRLISLPTSIPTKTEPW